MPEAVTGLAIAIMREFARDLRRPLTINGIAKACGKAYPNIHRTTRKLIADGILTVETIGHAHSCKVNFSRGALLVTLAQMQGGIAPEAPEGAVIAWKRERDVLAIAAVRRKEPGVLWMTLDEFLADKELFATIGKHALIHGHAAYAHLLELHGNEVLR